MWDFLVVALPSLALATLRSLPMLTMPRPAHRRTLVGAATAPRAVVLLLRIAPSLPVHRLTAPAISPGLVVNATPQFSCGL
jgi:hypothetical protein